MKPITKYQADDGTVWATAEQALLRDELVAYGRPITPEARVADKPVVTFEETCDRDEYWATVPAKGWEYTDKAGHVHAYDDRLEYLTGTTYPTLVVRSKTHWDEDDDEEWTESWHECPKCGERIRTGTTQEMRSLPGFITFRVNGDVVDELEYRHRLAEFLAGRAEAKEGSDG